jgi:MinD-like ATPase involved in chromosome partitioning or flagellar assembly
VTLICFASQKGSPGTTATAIAVAAALKVSNGRRKVLVEADATGGTLAIRYGLAVEPGLLTLAAAVRGGLDVDGLWQHAQELPGGLPVVVCPDGSDQVHAAMSASGALLGRYLDELAGVDVICDVGRLAPGSPSLDFVAHASALLMVARPTAEQLQPAARKMISLRPQVRNLGWVLVGRKPYGAAEVEATYDFPVVGLIADDPRSVASIERGGMSKRLRRHPFVRSSTTLADTLAGWLSPINSARATAAVPSPPQPSVEPEPEPELDLDLGLEPAIEPDLGLESGFEPGPGLGSGFESDLELSPLDLSKPMIDLDWLPPAEDAAPDDSWDENEDANPFTVTADLDRVFERPNVASWPQPEPLQLAPYTPSDQFDRAGERPNPEQPVPSALVEEEEVAAERSPPPMPPPGTKLEPPAPVRALTVVPGSARSPQSASAGSDSPASAPPPMPGPENQLPTDEKRSAQSAGPENSAGSETAVEAKRDGGGRP